MTVKDAAKRLEISQSLAYRLIEEKQLGCVRIGQRGRRGKILVRESDIEAFLKSAQQEVRQRNVPRPVRVYFPVAFSACLLR